MKCSWGAATYAIDIMFCINGPGLVLGHSGHCTDYLVIVAPSDIVGKVLQAQVTPTLQAVQAD